MVRLGLGSESLIEQAALKEAFSASLPCEIFPLEAESGVRRQHFGKEKTRQGAYDRAVNAGMLLKDRKVFVDFIIGVENGMWTPDASDEVYASGNTGEMVDGACICCVSSRLTLEGNLACALGSYPPSVFFAWSRVISVPPLEKRVGLGIPPDPFGDKWSGIADPHLVLSAGEMSRGDFLQEAFAKLALRVARVQHPVLSTSVHELVDVMAFQSPTIRLDCRYATSDNFLGRAVYDTPRCILLRGPATSLLKAAEELAQQGYGLLLFDGYRPHHVTQLFWDMTPPELRDFVANPATGSKHNRGCAIDLTLYKLSADAGEAGGADVNSIQEVEMPSLFDEMSERASPDYKGGSAQSRGLRDLLRAAMERNGFTVEHNEWWHFNHCDWLKGRPLLDVPFSAVPTTIAR